MEYLKNNREYDIFLKKILEQLQNMPIIPLVRAIGRTTIPD